MTCFIFLCLSLLTLLAVCIFAHAALTNTWNSVVARVRLQVGTLLAAVALFVLFLGIGWFLPSESFLSSFAINIAASLWIIILGWLVWEILDDEKYNKVKRVLTLPISSSIQRVLSRSLGHLYISFFREVLSEDEQIEQLKKKVAEVKSGKTIDITSLSAIDQLRAELIRLRNELDDKPASVNLWILRRDLIKSLSIELGLYADDLKDVILMNQGFLYDEAVRRSDFSFLSNLHLAHAQLKKLSDLLTITEYILMVKSDRKILDTELADLLSALEQVINSLESWSQEVSD